MAGHLHQLKLRCHRNPSSGSFNYGTEDFIPQANHVHLLSRVKCIPRDPLENIYAEQSAIDIKIFVSKKQKVEHHEHYKLAKCGKYKKLLLLFHLSAACAGPNDDSGVAVKSYSAIGKVFKYLPSLSSADAK